MKYILSDLLNMRKGRIVNITVWDCFTGEQMCIFKRDLFRDYNTHTCKKNKILSRKDNYDDELPF